MNDDLKDDEIKLSDDAKRKIKRIIRLLLSLTAVVGFLTLFSNLSSELFMLRASIVISVLISLMFITKGD